MAISCEPADLIAASKCFVCVPKGMQNEVIIYLLQQIAGNTQTPNELLESAKCLKCLPPGTLPEIQVYLLCQIVNGLQ